MNPMVEGNLKFNVAMLKRGKFVWEGYGCNRCLRYLGQKRTYEEVRNVKGRGDIRTHNVDLVGCTICVENNNSQEVTATYRTAEEAKAVFLDIVSRDAFERACFGSKIS